MMPWKEWLLDITNGDNPPCFVPYERETDSIVFGMNLITDRSPGALVGVIHSDGQDAVEKYCSANPDWHERFQEGK